MWPNPQIRSFLRIWSHLLKKSVMENIFVQCWHQILRGTISFSRSKSSNASLEVKEVLISDKKLPCLLKSSGSQFSSLTYQGLVDISVKSQCLSINPSLSSGSFVIQRSTGRNKIVLNSRKNWKILMTYK